MARLGRQVCCGLVSPRRCTFHRDQRTVSEWRRFWPTFFLVGFQSFGQGSSRRADNTFSSTSLHLEGAFHSFPPAFFGSPPSCLLHTTTSSITCSPLSGFQSVSRPFCRFTRRRRSSTNGPPKRSRCSSVNLTGRAPPVSLSPTTHRPRSISSPCNGNSAVIAKQDERARSNITPPSPTSPR